MEVAYFQIDRSWFSLLVVFENYVAGNESVMYFLLSLFLVYDQGASKNNADNILGFLTTYTVSEGKVFFLNLALTERNMQVKFDLKLSVYSLGLDI